MSTALATQTPALPAEQIDLVRRTVAKDATHDELALFLYDCQRRGIHPLDKLLHFTKRGGRYTPVTSIDFMRSQAAMTGEMAGSDDPVFTEKDGKLVSATVTVYRITQGQRFAYAATARWSEYCPDNAPMWKRMPHTMLGKCAEALALRKAFPQQLAGLYSREEMDQADRDQKPVVVEAPKPEPAKVAAVELVKLPTTDATVGTIDAVEPAIYVVKVESHPSATNPNIVKGDIVLSNGETHTTRNGQALALAEQLCQDREPVELSYGPRGGFLGVKRKNRSAPAAAVVDAPLTADDIPF